MAKIKVDDALVQRAGRVALSAGYSSVDEFIAHCIEQGIQKAGPLEEDKEAERRVAEQLRGLGYIE